MSHPIVRFYIQIVHIPFVFGRWHSSSLIFNCTTAFNSNFDMQRHLLKVLGSWNRSICVGTQRSLPHEMGKLKFFRDVNCERENFWIFLVFSFVKRKKSAEVEKWDVIDVRKAIL